MRSFSKRGLLIAFVALIAGYAAAQIPMGPEITRMPPDILPYKNWGPLCGVYVDPSSRHVKLVFEDASGTIRIAYVNETEQKLTLTGTIARK